MHALLLALLAATPPPVVSPEEPGTEVTVSGAAQAELLFPVIPQITITRVQDGGVFEIGGGGFLGREGVQPRVSAHLLLGWNFRVAGQETTRAGLDVDLRLLGGLSYNYLGYGWRSPPLFGLPVAGEVATTWWLNPHLGVSAGVLAGLDLTFLAALPCARLTLGVTF